MKKLIILIIFLLFSCATQSKRSLFPANTLAKTKSVVIVWVTKIGKEGDKLVQLNAMGTGFVIAPKHIMTNYHVVDGSILTTTENYNGDKIYSTVVYANPETDIAILKMETDPEGLEPLEVDTGSKVGDQILIIGHPSHDYFLNVSGIVSAIKYQGEVLEIHTDAMIYYGSSGSPMINTEGKVIGISGGFYSQNRIGIGIHAKHIIEAMKAIDL